MVWNKILHGLLTMALMVASPMNALNMIVMVLLGSFVAGAAAESIYDTGRIRSLERNLQVINQSGSRMEVFWVHPENNELFQMSPDAVLHGAEFPLSSFVGHEFELHELPSKKTGICDKTQEQTCRRAVFRVSDADDQFVTIDKDFSAVFSDSRIQAHSEATDLIQDCQYRFGLADVDTNNYSQDDLSRLMNKLVECVQGGVATTLERVNEEISFQAQIRKDMARKLENYTCDDDELDSTEPIATETWISEKDEIPRQVQIMHRRPSSQIHVIENFIMPEECQAMEEAASSKLHRATVADGKGGSQLSENRKAMQAGIVVPWGEERDGNPIPKLSRRVYDYTNHVLNLGIEEFGQEDLMSIQYFGRGTNDTAPDRYTPHCDGDCTGLPHKYGNRMATMVMYCTLPESGGHTNFANAGVHVKPRAGNGIFFSYINPETKVMDTGFTEHSGCPVWEGEKKIVTQWIRYGVDSENPWTSFNTLGIKKSEESD